KCKEHKVFTPTRKTVRDSNNQLATITSVTLVREFSKKGICRNGVTYFFRGSLFVVRNGCKGLFKICYEEVVTTAAPVTTAEPEPCKKVAVKSSKQQFGRVDVKDANGNPVHIVHVHVWDQISEIKCVEWVNFFFSMSYIITKNGCHATFKVCYRVKTRPTTTLAPLTTTAVTPSPGCDLIRLLSRKKRPASVRFGDATIAKMTLVRQFSKVNCIFRLTFGFRPNRAFARKGCRGLFEICFNTAPLTTATPETCKTFQILKPTRTVVRDSNGEPATITKVTLVREISRKVCIKGRNFLFRGSLFIVTGGCKGVFTVCYTVTPTTAAPLTTTEPPKICKKVTVKSKGQKPNRVDVKDANGNAVQIVHVHVWDQISDIKCVEWVNFFFSESFIIAQKGCHATFKVCYKPPKPTTTAAPLTTTQPPVKCKLFKVLKPSRITVTGSNGQPATIVSVSLRREISRRVCKRGRNFFFRGPVFTVRRGCKGVFRVCYLNDQTTPAPLTTTTEPPVKTCKKVTVKSTLTQNGRVDVTDANGNSVQIVHVHVWDQISVRKCIEWVNFFYFESYVVAQKGCHATFKVCFISVTTTTAAPITTAPPTVKCKKYLIFKPTRKIVIGSNNQQAAITRIVLLHEISKRVCRRGVNFFFRGSLFVVNGGCKGKFQVCFVDIPTTLAPLTTTAPPKVCKQITLKSTKTRIAKADVKDANGNPVQIVHVHVWDQISVLKCVEWVNFFFTDSRIVAKGGCQATFKVCYTVVPTTTAAPLTTTAPPVRCKKYRIFTHTRKVVRDSNNNPATITSVTLKREFSKHVCRRGKNFFFRGSLFVVRMGCKGLFKVCYNLKPTTAAPLTTASPAKCRKFTLKENGEREVRDSRGQPAVITSITLKREFSSNVCANPATFSFSGSLIQVDSGCKGVFIVCFLPAPPPVPLTTVNPNLKCRKHTFKVPTEKTFVLPKNQPAEIVSVELVRELENGVCTLNTNYFFSGATLIVRGTCKGVFIVCIRPAGAQPLTTTAAPS
ncbi:D-galacturonic acid binding lectin, partial [Plakobranchus ocellatus]